MFSSFSTPVLQEFSFISENEFLEVENSELYYEISEPINNGHCIEGNRIVDLGYVLKWSLNLQYNHSKICTGGQLYIKDEERLGLGLVSCIIFKCTMCPKEYKYYTENPESKHSKINTGAVWGTLSTGNTFGHLEELLSVMDIPPMTAYKFKQIEEDLADVSI